MARRSTGWLLALVAATVISGCGSGEEDTSFADATDRTCSEVATAATALSQRLVRGAGADEAAALKAAIDAYAKSVTAAADHLKQATPKKADREFQRVAVNRLREHAADLRSAVSASRNGALSSEIVSKLTTTDEATMPLIPPAILDRAPACARVAR